MWYQSSAHLLHVLTVVVLPSSLLYQLIGPANLKRDNSPGIYSWSCKGIKKYSPITIEIYSIANNFRVDDASNNPLYIHHFDNLVLMLVSRPTTGETSISVVEPQR